MTKREALKVQKQAESQSIVERAELMKWASGGWCVTVHYRHGQRRFDSFDQWAQHQLESARSDWGIHQDSVQ